MTVKSSKDGENEGRWWTDSLLRTTSYRRRSRKRKECGFEGVEVTRDERRETGQR